MGATLSTGDQTWEVKVMGNLAQKIKKQKQIQNKQQQKKITTQVMGNLPQNNTWTNIAIRWEPLKFNDEVAIKKNDGMTPNNLACRPPTVRLWRIVAMMFQVLEDFNFSSTWKGSPSLFYPS